MIGQVPREPDLALLDGEPGRLLLDAQQPAAEIVQAQAQRTASSLAACGARGACEDASRNIDSRELWQRAACPARSDPYLLVMTMRFGAEWQAERTAERANLAAAPEEVKAARVSPGLIKRLRARLGITQGELATLVGVSQSAVGSWEYAKAKPEGHNREALVALRKLGKREVAGILATKAAESPRKAKGTARGRKKPR